jgi:hypothetical protein
MIIALTHYTTGKKTLINYNFVVEAHSVFDSSTNRTNTKITYATNAGDKVINVDETPEEIHEIIYKAQCGEKQVVDWTPMNRIEDKFSNSYKQQYRQRQFPNERNYNRQETFNENL